MIRTSARTIAIVTAAAAVVSVGAVMGHAVAAPRTASPTQSPTGNPFLDAVATSTSVGGYRVTWQASTSTVSIYATTNASGTGGTEVGHGHASGSVNISGLSSADRWYFRLVAANGRYVVVDDRLLHLADSPNSRDLGGYRTTSGQWVKVGLVYRAAQLCGLNAGEIGVLNALNLHEDLDLRSAAEETGCPDPSGIVAPYKRIGFMAEDDPDLTLGGATTDAEVYAAIKAQGGPQGNNAIFQEEIAMPYEVSQVRAVFSDILAANGAPILIHCSAGQDRTGWVSYVLLRLLGVSRQTAMADYMLSAKLNKSSYAAAEQYYESIGFSANQARLGTEVRPQRIQITLNSIDTIFGSFNKYVSDGLGLTHADIAQLRKTYDYQA